MEVQVRLQNNYIQVLREENGAKTFGGDQGFFAKTAQADKKEKRKRSSGCGVIALSDMLFYLGRKRKELQIWPSSFYEQKELTEAEYRKWFAESYRMLLGIPFSSGVSSFWMTFRINRFFQKKKSPYRAFWGFRISRIHERTMQMLQQDIPVILCIPVMLLPWDKRDGIRFYGKEELENGKISGSKAQVSGHFVVVTGILSEKEEQYYEISSWGRKYYMKRKDYEKLCRSHFLGNILGNILVITARKGLFRKSVL